MPSKLAQWLRYQEQVNPRGVDLGLDRVRAVWQRMGGRSPARCVVTVGGTNGKGSTVALLESMFRAFGWRTGAYISPHLLRYNERICLNGVELADAEFIASFERIEAARGKTLLTYFEFATLARFGLYVDPASVFFHDQATREFTGQGGIYDFLRKFRMTIEQALVVSDHLPVWAEFSIYEGGTPGHVAKRRGRGQR